MPIRPLILSKGLRYIKRMPEYVRFLKSGNIAIPRWMIERLAEPKPGRRIGVRTLIDEAEKNLYLEALVLTPKESAGGRVPDGVYKLWLPDPRGGKNFYQMSGRNLRRALGIPVKKGRYYRAYVQEKEGRVRIPLKWYHATRTPEEEYTKLFRKGRLTS